MPGSDVAKVNLNISVPISQHFKTHPTDGPAVAETEGGIEDVFESPWSVLKELIVKVRRCSRSC
jgi:hypothetical protein